MEVKRKGIYLARLTRKKGSSVEGGIRPVVILQNDKGNQTSPTVIVVPVTSVLKKMYLPTHVFLHNEARSEPSMAMLEQIQTIDVTQLIEYRGNVTDEEMERIEQAAKKSLGMIRRQPV